jgi:hypothetical protein
MAGHRISNWSGRKISGVDECRWLDFYLRHSGKWLIPPTGNEQHGDP